MASAGTAVVETPLQENVQKGYTSNAAWKVKSWGSISNNNSVKCESTSFADVMSEQLANELQLDENYEMENPLQSETVFSNDSTLNEPVEWSKSNDTSNDEVLAQILQAQMDEEFNESVTRQENQVNKNSKVRLSFNNYRTDSLFTSDDNYDDEEEDEDVDETGREGCSEADQSSNMLEFPPDKGYVVFGNELVTKHDKEICGRRNTAKMEDSLPPGFRTGDARGMDLQLSNKIYNSLKKHAYSEQRRGQRLHETKEHYTAEHAVDERTRLLLHRLVDRGIVAGVNGVISIGKEAVVVHVDGGDVAAADLVPLVNENNNDISCKQIPKECAIKIYKTTLNEFRCRDKYIKDDYRFKDRFKKLNPRKIIHMWAEKEMHNLNRMNEAGIPCPEVVLLRKHVLVMAFIGENQQPAPKLKCAILSSLQKKSAYKQVVTMMKTLFNQCKLIHADLSEFNLLWHDQKVWMIDVSQSVEPSHPHGLEFLLRDCTNISKFFTSIGVPDVLEPLELFNSVSGLDIPITDEAEFRCTIERMENATEEHAQQGKRKSSQFLEQI
ncbi:serine/threonine-protein kinase RIO3-like [Ciona intestinalis]